MHELVEREVELAAFDRALSAALKGTGSVVLLAGEAGIGKSALARAFADRAAVRAVFGYCERVSVAVPLV